MLGALVTASTAAGYVLAHTTGLPGGYKEEEWQLLGIVTLVLDGLYLAVWALSTTVMPASSSATERSSRYEPAAEGSRYTRR